MFEFIVLSSVLWGPVVGWLGFQMISFVVGSHRFTGVERRLIASGLVSSNVLAEAEVKASVGTVAVVQEGAFVERVSEEIAAFEEYMRAALVSVTVKRQALRVLDAVRQVVVPGRKFSAEEEHALESVVFSHLPESVRLFELLPERSLKRKFYQKSLVEQLVVLEDAVKSVDERVVADAESQLEANRLFLESKFVGSRLSLGSRKTERVN